MSLEDYLAESYRYSRLSLDDIVEFSERLLERLDQLPPDPADSPMLSAAPCALSLVGSHWGVYGAGVTGIEVNGSDDFRLQMLLDPVWLDIDFREGGARQPWLLARDARWATRQLQGILDLPFPEDTVLRASLPPRPQTMASGDGSRWPSATTPSTEYPQTGTVGPPVSYTDAAGNAAVGYLTAGHVAPPRAPALGLANVDIQPAYGPALTVAVHASRVATGIRGLSTTLAHAVDAAIIESGGSSVSGLGGRGSATQATPVERVVTGSNRTGEVIGYSRWIATATSAWRDCYLVAAPNGDFSEPGHSGAAVTNGSEVIGIVLGAAAAVPGCSTALSYVQDIDAITTTLNCTVIP